MRHADSISIITGSATGTYRATINWNVQAVGWRPKGFCPLQYWEIVLPMRNFMTATGCDFIQFTHDVEGTFKANVITWEQLYGGEEERVKVLVSNRSVTSYKGSSLVLIDVLQATGSAFPGKKPTTGRIVVDQFYGRIDLIDLFRDVSAITRSRPLVAVGIRNINDLPIDVNNSSTIRVNGTTLEYNVVVINDYGYKIEIILSELP